MWYAQETRRPAGLQQREEDEAGEAVGPYRYHENLGFYSKGDGEGLPWWSSGSDSMFPMQGLRLDPWSGN